MYLPVETNDGRIVAAKDEVEALKDEDYRSADENHLHTPGETQLQSTCDDAPSHCPYHRGDELLHTWYESL